MKSYKILFFTLLDSLLLLFLNVIAQETTLSIDTVMKITVITPTV